MTPSVLAKSFPVPAGTTASAQFARPSIIAVATLLHVPSPPTTAIMLAPEAIALVVRAASSPGPRVSRICGGSTGPNARTSFSRPREARPLPALRFAIRTIDRRISRTSLLVGGPAVTGREFQIADGNAEVQQPLLQENHVGSPVTAASRCQVKNVVTSAFRDELSG